MTIYLVIHEDRHVDVAVYPHLAETTAVQHAKDIATDYEGDVEEQVESWLYCIRLSGEGDCVRVVKAEVMN